MAWPKFWFTESVRVRDGAAAGLAGAKVFRAHRFPQPGHRTLNRPLHRRCPHRKVLRSLRRADLGAIRRICFRAHVCVFEGRFARHEQANAATGRGRRMKWRDGFGLWPKQTEAQSVGAAGERRAREAGKPGIWARRRGEAAWPNAQSAKGRYLPCDTRSRAGEDARHRAPRSTLRPPLTFSTEPGAIAQASQAMREANKEEGVCSMTPKWPEITEGNQDGFTLLCPTLQKHCI